MPNLSAGRTVRESKKVIDLNAGRSVRSHEEIYRDVKDADSPKLQESKRIARDLGADHKEVNDNIEIARQADEQPDFDSVRDTAPTLAKKTEDPAYMALVKQDIANLQRLERATRVKPALTVGRLIGATWESFRSQMSQFAEVDATAMEAADADDMTAFDELIVRGSQATQDEYTKLLHEAEGKEYLPGAKRNTAYLPEAFGKFLEERTAKAREVADKYQMPEEYATSSGYIEDVFKAASGSTAGMFLGPGAMFAQIKGASIQGMRAEGVTDPKILGAASTIEAMGSTPLESAGTLIEIVILSKLPGGSKLLKAVMGRFAKTHAGKRSVIKIANSAAVRVGGALTATGSTEALEEYLQAYPGEYALLSAKNPGDDSDALLEKFYERVTSKEFQEEAIEAGKIGAGAGVLFGAGGAAISATYRKQKAKMEAERTAEQIEVMKEIAKEIELLKNDPKSFTDYLREVEESTGGGKFFLQVDRVIEVLQAEGIDPITWIEGYGVSAAELTEALRMGEGLVGLDSASVIAGLAQGQDDALNTLQEGLTAAPEDFPMSQVEEGTQSEEVVFKRLQELYDEEQTRTVSREEVAEIEASIVATGKYTAEQASQHALLIGARANTWAKKTGKSASEWFERWGLEVREGEMLFYPHESDISTEKTGVLIYEADKVVGRTSSPQPDWYTKNQYKSSYTTQQAAVLVKKAREGGKLTETQTLFVDEAIKINKVVMANYQQSLGVFGWLKSQGLNMADSIEIIDAFVAEPSKLFTVAGEEKSASDIQSDYASGVGRFWQADLESEAFKKWFGDSKVVDEDGKPLVVYHGSPEAFDAFDPDRAPQGVFWFAKNKADIESGEAGALSARVIRPFYLSIQKMATREEYERYGYGELQDLGYDGVELEGDTYIVFGNTQMKSTENVGTFDPSDPRILRQGGVSPRGAVEFKDGQTIVELYERSNLSTMLHEIGHVFLEDLKTTAELDGVGVEDWAAVQEWLGVDGEITTEQHEKFARAFEAYLRDGQAPSIELRSAFESFRKWLVTIYRSMLLLDVEINDEIRGVFDAMLATEQEITDAQALAAQMALLDEAYLQAAGATQDEIDEYKRSVRAAGAEAERDGFKHKVVGRDERRREWRKQAKATADAMLIFELIDELRKVGLDPEELDATFGKRTRKGIPNTLKRHGGLSADQAAARFGYESGRALVEDIQETPSRKGWIEEQVDAQEQAFNDRWDAEEAIHNSVARKLLEQESLLLAQKLQRTALTRKALRLWAEEATEALPAAEAMNVYKLIAQSRRLRKKAIAKQKAGKDAEAFDLNEKVRMTEELIAVRYKVRDEIQKAERRWKRAGKSALPPRKGAFKYDERYAGQIRKILSRYGMLGKKQLPGSDVNLADFFNALLVEAQAGQQDDVINTVGEGAGFAGFLFDENDTRNWRKELTLAEVREVDNLIKYLLKEGRTDKADILSDGTSLKETAATLTEPMAGIKATRNQDETKVLARITRKARKFMAEHVPLQYILMRADGFKSGINIARLFNTVTERVDDQHKLVKRVNDAIGPALEHFKKRAQEHPEILTHVPLFDQFKTAQPSLVWTYDKVMAVALNMGNTDNAAKLIAGYTIEGQEIDGGTLQEITSILTAEDWRMVQRIWDGINIMWAPTVTMHERLKGYKPQKVKGNPLTVVTADGRTITLEGGYYPLKFDTRLNTEQSDLSAKQAEFEDLKQHQEALFPSVGPKAGQTMTRKATAGGRQVELGMGALARHISHASMYATMADVLLDADRITRAPEWKKAYKTAFGDTLYSMIRPALATTANPTAGRATMSTMDNVAEWLRARTAPIILFFNLRVAVKQPYSIFNLYSAMRTDGKALGNIGKGYKKAMRAPVALYNEVHDLSPYMERRAQAIDRELQRGLRTGEYRKKGTGKKAFEATQDWGDEWGPIFIRLGDFAAAYPGWWAAYEQGLGMFNGDLGKAVHHADNLIRSTQPSFAPIDTAALQRSNAGMARLFTMFTGYTMKYANRRHFYWEGFRKGEISGRDFAFHVALERMAPSLLMTTMLTLLTRGVPEDDEEWEMFFEDALIDLLLFQVAGRVGIQEIAAMLGLSKYARRGTFQTPLSAVPDSIQRRMGKIKAAIDSGDEDEIIEALFWFMLTATEVATKIPLAQRGGKLMRNIEEFEDDERTAPGVLF